MPGYADQSSLAGSPGPGALTFIVGEEELLVERAAAAALAAAGPDPDVHDVLAAELGPGELSLLTSPSLARVRHCASASCGWLFVDVSRNHSRRWCDMEDCGNRAKARRHYARLKER